MTNADTTKNFCGYVALIGAPNAGKSTLTNQLVGGKVAIVTPKAQTTRTRVTGLTVFEQTQIIFVDTPGIFQPEKRLDRSMVHAAWLAVDEADAIAVIVDVSRKHPLRVTEAVLTELTTRKKKAVLVLNKIDLVPRERLLTLATEFSQAFPFEHIFMISALKDDGVTDLLTYFAGKMPEGVWLYPEDDMTTMPLRLLAAEITREQVFLQLHDELPYAMTVETESFDESNPEKVAIDQTVYVRKESQRAIVLGHKGAQLKSIGTKARLEMQKQFGFGVHLNLFVKVRDKWLEDPERYHIWGLEYKV